MQTSRSFSSSIPFSPAMCACGPQRCLQVNINKVPLCTLAGKENESFPVPLQGSESSLQTCRGLGSCAGLQLRQGHTDHPLAHHIEILLPLNYARFFSPSPSLGKHGEHVACAGPICAVSQLHSCDPGTTFVPEARVAWEQPGWPAGLQVAHFLLPAFSDHFFRS